MSIGLSASWGISRDRDYSEGAFKKMLSKVRPDLVIFSIGRGMYSTPNPDIVGQLRELLPETRIVCTQLSEHCADQLPAVPSTHLSEVFAAGREHGACCGVWFHG